jgi:Ca-activated chloride channel family protein
MRLGTLALLSVLGMSTAAWFAWQLAAFGRTRLLPWIMPEPSASTGPTDPALAATFRVGDSLAMEGRLGHARLRAGQEGETYLYTEVGAEAKQVARTPAPLNLSIVIDRSGSMRGKKLDNAVAAARGAVRRLRDGDAVSVLSYSADTVTLSPVTTVDVASRERVMAAIGALAPLGNTCISCGLESASELLRQKSGMVNRILLLSDGEATTGVRTVEGFRALAARCREAGISITSIGMDVEYNERVMAELAIESNGRHYFVENPEGLPRIFDQEMESLTRTTASEAELVLTLAPGITAAQVYDRTYRAEGQRLTVPLGTFAAGEQKTFLARLRLPAKGPGTEAIADVELHFRDLVQGTRRSERGRLALTLSSDPTLVAALDPVVQLRLSRSEARSALFQANELYRAGRVDEARAVVKKQKDTLAAAQRDRAARPAAAAAPVPAARSREIDADYQRQSTALEKAEDGFKSEGEASPKKASKAPAQVRANADYATQAGY